MKSVTATTYGTPDRVRRTTYVYGADGLRVAAIDEVDANADGTYETSTTTEYLNDADNPSGYGQALRETTRDTASGQIQEVIVTTLGLDQIAQVTTTYTGGVAGTPSTLVLGADGHGSTRFLTGLDGAIAVVASYRQVFDYDAYGELLNLDPAAAATSLLYSGEMFDARVGLQYLRARWYDASTGRFNSLDTFFGDLQDPQSLHKYLYVHGDPILNVDPTGHESLISTLSASSIGSTLNQIDGAAGQYALDAAYDASNGVSAGQSFLNGSINAGVGLAVNYGLQASVTALLFLGKSVIGFAKVGNFLARPGTMLPRIRTIPGAIGEVIGSGEASVLGNRLLRKNGISDLYDNIGNYNAHHIITVSVARKNKIIKKIGMDIDDATNGIFLPRPDYHNSKHNEYNKAIARALDLIPDNLSIEATMDRVYDIQARASWAFADGSRLVKGYRLTEDEWFNILKWAN